MAVASDRIERRRQYLREWAAANRDKRRASRRESERRNPEKTRARHAAYQSKNRDKYNEYAHNWRCRNRAKSRSIAIAYYAANAERIKPIRAAYRAATKDKARERNRRWRIKNSARLKLSKARYARENRDRIRASRREYIRQRIKLDPAFRLKNALANRIRIAVKKRAGVKAKKTMELLGCDVAFLREYIAARFTQGMTWQNYGTAWQIDHIIPVSSFDLNDPAQQKRCFNYSNLQPLRPLDNLNKSDKLPATHQAELL